MSGAGPSLDTSWGSGGVVEVGGECGTLTGAVEDAATGDVFVGCSTGALSRIRVERDGEQQRITVGNGSSFGGIVVSPLVDSSKGYVYAVSGTNGTSPSPMIQVADRHVLREQRELGGARTSAGKSISVPSLNTNYYSGATSSTWAIFSCGYDSTGSLTELYDVGFNSSAVLNPGTPPSSNEFQLASDVEACSPLTGFKENLLFSPPFSPPVNWLFLKLRRDDG